jgi:transposase
MAKRKTSSYPESFRKEAVRLANLPDRTAVDVANELGLDVGQIYNWRTQLSKLSKKQLKIHEGVNYSKEESSEFRRLRQENARLKEERDFLKKATAYFANIAVLKWFANL